MKILLIVIAVFNGRYYYEEPVQGIQYKTEVACLAAAAKYATGGVEYNKAICIPKIDAQ
jgi:hypothetical protein